MTAFPGLPGKWKMGITVVLENERGVALGSVEDPRNLLHRLLPTPEDVSFHVLRFVDRYGDTVINRLQLETFLREWDRLTQEARTEEERTVLSQVRDLATKAQRQIHTYVKFLRRLRLVWSEVFWSVTRFS
jgi:hypothetical protein